MFHNIALTVGFILVMVWILFLSDQRLSDGEWKIYRLIFGRPPVDEDPGVDWGIWILLFGGILVIYGLWPN